MKKAIKIIGVLFGLLVVGLVVVYFFLGSIIKTGVETVGPDLTQGDVKLESASLSIFGSGGIKGLEIGNAKNGDFSSPFAFKMGSVDVSVEVGSVTSDKIVINEIIIDGAELCYEGLTGKNHKKIIENIEAYTGPAAEKTEEAPKDGGSEKKLEIKLFKMTNTKVHVYGFGKNLASLSLPDFTKEGIGSGGDASLSDSLGVLYESILGSVTTLVGKSKDALGDSWGKLSEAGSALKEKSGDVVDGVKEGAKGLVDGVKGLFE